MSCATRPGSMPQVEDPLLLAKDLILQKDQMLDEFYAKANCFGYAVGDSHPIDITRFEVGDQVEVIDRQDEYLGRIFQIRSINTKKNTLDVKTEDGNKTYKIGIGTDTQQVKLLGKDDGSNVRVSYDGKVSDAYSPRGEKIRCGDYVKVHPCSRQIVEVLSGETAGKMAVISRVLPSGDLEVETDGMKKIIKSLVLKVDSGDTVILDETGQYVIKKFPAADVSPYKPKTSVVVNWDDIGGIPEAKQQLIEAIELPIKCPDIFEFYNQKPPKGVLLYGPPGCGKTMLGKAAATSIAKLHGKEMVDSGFNYVKGPEILSKWVGESESNIRSIFTAARKHFEQHGFPAVTFVDEADAVLFERNTDMVNHHIHSSLVAMWLAEMDGLDAHNGIFIFATNRSKVLDGAMVREGRIDRHIKVPRPDDEAAESVLAIHLRNVPLSGVNVNDAITAILGELRNEKLTLATYRHKNASKAQADKKVYFNLSDTISGSLLAGIVHEAKSIAMRRDLKTRKKQGVRTEDFSAAVENVYNRHKALNHRFDFEDFLDEVGVSADDLEKVS